MPGSTARVTGRAPLSFRIAKWLQRNGLRGGTRLQSIARSLGWLDVTARYPLAPQVSVDVPLWRRAYDLDFVRRYEDRFVTALADAARQLLGPITLVDCGADIGLVSARLVAQCPVIDRVIAFEPNADSYAHLAVNMGRLPIPAQAIAAAVADFDGRGELQHPGHDPHSSHAAFLVRNDAGSIPVRQVDGFDLGSGTDLILKIDVEGGELAVVRGARRTLRTARAFVVGFEGHPAHQARTGVDGVEVMRLLQGIRPCSFRVAERPDVRLSLDRPFFEQVVPAQVCNVVCATTP